MITEKQKNRLVKLEEEAPVQENNENNVTINVNLTELKKLYPLL